MRSLANTSVVLIVLLVFFGGCKTEVSEYAGYSLHPNGFQYKLISLGDGDKAPTKQSYLQLSVQLRTLADSLFYSTKHLNHTGSVFFKWKDSAAWEAIFTQVHEGDSLTMIVGADDFFSSFFHTSCPDFLADSDSVILNLKLLKIHTLKSYEARMDHFEKELNGLAQFEHELLHDYLITNNVKPTQIKNGVVFLGIQPGNGVYPLSGERIRIKMTGSFLDGEVFDKMFSHQPFEVTLGEQGQLLPGIDAALRTLKKGSKAKIILPSHLAFGKQGSGDGRIQPFTPVVYNLELAN